MEKVALKVVGMTCGHCEEAVKNALMSVDGVASVSIAFHEEQVEVEYDPEKATEKNLINAVKDQGYGVA
ncbi:heavy-metal-associated domain-containing protein [Bacillus sp. ISL-47]|uniref:heavy-metal-associated domain-containing protein n=1 Tax=Bacillus sp. ISL-47 TaxID=2819130 RepID=UPI001BE6D0D6|nr:cation transporter [Bacillus sp. ISL-47]MBT2690225.1 heavy-metal-associated domain-containing protein [Bacillus sp. ISL-47]MBT2709010.1 heavy-metal-associated domain-containing protein [Pseudomonas sp. ISL-84]